MPPALQTHAQEPPGDAWQLVDVELGQVVAVGSVADVRLARVQYERAQWAAGIVPASTYIRPASGWRTPRRTARSE